MTPIEILKQYFGYDAFRGEQTGLIDTLLHGRDALCVMPTGAGKSLCYQIPAMLLPGVTIVVSPLISLMRDQVQSLVANGIPAAYINSSLSESQCERAMLNARGGQYKIIYIAPERLLTPSMLALARTLRISLLAVDEAHCVSQWGQDFRPSYLDIPIFAGELSARPVLAAFTATATPRVREDICNALGLEKPLTLVTGFDRPNLYFGVQQPKDKYAALASYLRQNNGSGIVYCSTRKEVEKVAERLAADSFSVARYHAGLPDAERSRAQDDFLHDRVRVIVATNAFGMGIDKSNVRFVVHYNMPLNIESYYQEAGRAGRDGLHSDCILLYARKDIMTALFLINKSENPDEIARSKRQLAQMERYCETAGCLRRFMLGYFGEPVGEDCHHCGNCNGSFTETDVTVDAQKVLSHIARLNKMGKWFMFTHTADILLGKSDDFTDLSTFGIMKGATRRYIRRLLNRLETLGYVESDQYLRVTPKAKEVLLGSVAVTIRNSDPVAQETAERPPKEVREPRYAFSDALLSKLKALRLSIAREEKVPAYIIFSDATLVDMCQKHPRTDTEMLSVSGVGKVKMERYGERFLALLGEEAPCTAPRGELRELTEKLFFEQFETEDSGLQISVVADRINTVLIRYGKPKTSGMKLNNLLMDAGYLQLDDGSKVPTEHGKSLGITIVERNSKQGGYTQCLFGKAAQQVCAELFIKTLSDEI